MLTPSTGAHAWQHVEILKGPQRESIRELHLYALRRMLPFSHHYALSHRLWSVGLCAPGFLAIKKWVLPWQLCCEGSDHQYQTKCTMITVRHGWIVLAKKRGVIVVRVYIERIGSLNKPQGCIAVITRAWSRLNMMTKRVHPTKGDDNGKQHLVDVVEMITVICTRWIIWWSLRHIATKDFATSDIEALDLQCWNIGSGGAWQICGKATWSCLYLKVISKSNSETSFKRLGHLHSLCWHD